MQCFITPFHIHGAPVMSALSAICVKGV